nr:vacuolar protein-sorting-associated protein 33 homolog [Ipomoea batatas]
MAPGPLETPRRSAVGLQRDLEIAFDGGLNLPSLDPPNLQSNSQVKLDVDFVNPASLLVVVAAPVAGVEGDDVIAPERRAQVGGVLVALVERFEILGAKPLALVERGGFEVVVVDADALVGVADGEVEGEVVVEGAVGGGEVELGEGGVVHVEFDLVGAEDEPEDQRHHAQNHQEGKKGIERIGEASRYSSLKAATATPTPTPALQLLSSHGLTPLRFSPSTLAYRDKLFKEIRNQNFEVVVQVLRQRATSMKQDYTEMQSTVRPHIHKCAWNALTLIPD